MFTNRYIFTYSAVMVIIVAIILSAAATLLKPKQQFNERVEKMSGILASANIKPENKTDIPQEYSNYIREEWVVNTDGDIVGKYVDGQQIQGDIRAFDVKLKEELDKLSKEETKKKVNLPIYVLVKDSDTSYIIPLRGKGLWGAVWGNIALKNDFRTVMGATFGHKSETPGLGAEIATEAFQAQFKGKSIFDENYNFTSVKIVKGGVKNSKIDPSHGVDAISGGTITSDGVSAMLNDVLSIYEPFVTKHIK